MASGLSLQRAQVPKCCELCETETTIKWKCMQCSSLMCEKCKKIHSKVQTAIKHEIIDIKHVLDSNTVPTMDVITIPCDIHPRNTPCLFCSSCDVLVCPVCITDLHKKHNLEPLKKFFDGKIGEFEGYVNTIEREVLPFVRQEIDELNDIDIAQTAQYKDTIKKIIKHEKDVKRSVSKISSTLQEEMKLNWECITTEKLEKLSFLENRVREIEQFKEDFTSCIKSRKKEQIWNLARSIKPNILKQLDYRIKTTQKSFVPSEFDNILSFGSLEESIIRRSIHSKTMVEITNAYSVDCIGPEAEVLRILPYDYGKVMMTSSDEYEKALILNIDQDKSIEKEIMDIDVFDCISFNRGILMSVYNDTRILLLEPDGTKKVFLQFSNMQPLALHLNVMGDLIIGIRENGPSAFPLKDDSTRQVRIYDDSKNEKTVYEYDSNRKRLFTSPVSIASKDANLYVADKLNKNGSGRIVALSNTGNIEWIYDEDNFRPWSLNVTSSGKIIVAEHDVDFIRIIDENNGTVACITQNLGYASPSCVNIDKCGRLWIGCSGNTSKKQKPTVLVAHIILSKH